MWQPSLGELDGEFYLKLALANGWFFLFKICALLKNPCFTTILENTGLLYFWVDQKGGDKGSNDSLNAKPWA